MLKLNKFITKKKQFEISKKVVFNKEEHTYFLDGEKFQTSPSGIIKYRSHVPPAILHLAILRGVVIHKFIEMCFLTNFNIKKINEELKYYKFSNATLLKCQEIFPILKKMKKNNDVILLEECLASSTRSLCGTLDLLIYNKKEEIFELIDFKSGEFFEEDFIFSYLPQILGYEHLVNSNFELKKKLKTFIIFLKNKPKKVELIKLFNVKNW